MVLVFCRCEWGCEWEMVAARERKDDELEEGGDSCRRLELLMVRGIASTAVRRMVRGVLGAEAAQGDANDPFG